MLHVFEKKLQPINAVGSLKTIAEDFSGLLRREDNFDIKQEFPATFKRYSINVLETIKNFEAAQKLNTVGEREQFFVTFGGRAVGLCVITNQLDNPNGVDQTWPNMSGFILNPFRSVGLGRFSLEERMNIVRDNFNDHAWTLVRKGNVRSEHLVMDVGFVKTDQSIKDKEDYNLYLYNGKERVSSTSGGLEQYME